MLSKMLNVRRLLTIAAGGLVGAALVLAGGFIGERIVLGADEGAARERVEAEVRATFDTMASALQAMARPLADSDLLVAAVAEDLAAQRSLFDAAEAALAGAGAGAQLDDFAITVHATDGAPIAWSGRPSELPADRLQGTETWFFAQGALGLRLVYLLPVTTAAGARVGVVSAERAFTATTPFVFPTRFTQVSLELNFEGARTRPDATAFEVAAPAGGRLLTASVATLDLVQARERWRRATRSLAIIVLALAVVLLCGPLIDRRNLARRRGGFIGAIALCAAAILAGRALLRLASVGDWSSAPLFSAATYASPSLPPFLTSPFDYLVTALTLGGLVALAFFGVEAWRLAWRNRRAALSTPQRLAAYALLHLAAGGVLALLLTAHFAFIRDTITNATTDLLHFSLYPWDGSRIAIQTGLLLWHTSTLGFGVLVLRAAAAPWRTGRHSPQAIVGTALLWCLPLTVWLLSTRARAEAQAPLLLALAAIVLIATLATRLKARYRHGSQAFRLVMLTLGLVAPALAFYPAVFRLAWESKVQQVELRYAPQALTQRQTIQELLQESLVQIDRFPGLADLVTADAGEPLSDRAFQVWQGTGIAAYPITSSVELFGADGRLVSRYAFNLPDDLRAVPRSQEQSCAWEVFEEVSPFFAAERRVLHAGRAVCVASRAIGSIVVHAMLDYADLPFIASRTPYVELLRPADPLRTESLSGGDIEYVVYGWSRTPIYASRDTAWGLDDETFERVASSRTPFWAQLERGDERFDVYLTNDRFGVYALGFPVVAPLGHLVNLAELTVLAAGSYLALLLLNLAFAGLSRRGTSARALLREVRASFYRKLFFAFVAASVVPVIILAILTRNYVATQMSNEVEQEAVRTAAAARRVVEDLVAPRAAQQGAGIDDNLMVWVSRLIDQDVNIFRGPLLQATSERNLFASGLLPRRTPAEVYRGLELRREAATVNRERIGTLEYLVAGTPVTARQIDAILTVPLTSRQQEIEDQIALLNRQVLLGALLFILAGAGLGYSLAERIADPVNRLTRATRRIARGELDVRVATASSDELGRLVEDFNSMAGELQRQRQELERTHRLEAWAEMSRQVAHDIKNPLTPIQLNAEHLRRVHADRGEPLGPILEECVGNILTQVRLLRQIASEFSNFASAPTARPASVDLGALLRDIVAPYVTALSDRLRFAVEIPDTLPAVHVDRSLVTRALTNVIENALHAMPGAGTLTVLAAARQGMVTVRVSDTGSGMDEEALARAFEPNFSTKAAGTGLGLPIAKRNIELNGGTIAIATGADGTTVEVALPRA